MINPVVSKDSKSLVWMVCGEEVEFYALVSRTANGIAFDEKKFIDMERSISARKFGGVV